MSTTRLSAERSVRSCGSAAPPAIGCVFVEIGERADLTEPASLGSGATGARPRGRKGAMSWRDYDQRHPVHGTAGDVAVLLIHVRALALELAREGARLPEALREDHR